MKVARCMSTQHPDNVTLPFFTENSVIGGEDEILEAYYTFSHLGIKEQMWDSEGKEVDDFVIKKLLSKYPEFFKDNKIGKDLFITLRVPNPAIERDEAKILLETLESIPRSFDTARKFYNEDIAPIFEIILPMTQSSRDANAIKEYYEKYIIKRQEAEVAGIKIKQWIGEFKPERINVIPLVEDINSMRNIKQIIGEYIQDKKLDYQRVFLARSDPALNYGWLSAVLMNKWALSQLAELEEEIGTEILPIIGVGSAPFRGNFSPKNINCLKGYPSVQTFTIQSAFKYDYEHRLVSDAIEEINGSKRKKAFFVQDNIWDFIEQYSEEYKMDLLEVAPWVNKIAHLVPQRRKRKMHIGLFGYSRGTEQLKLPRAITFCCALYSIGLPPEILGFGAFENTNQFDDFYKNFAGDFKDALKYVNIDNIRKISKRIADNTEKAIAEFDVEIDQEHKKATYLGKITSEKILKAAWLRRFLG